ncbi:MAG: helix-turn-helix transcriptional regulator [Candidatus Omnitrophica bacterium]|nr:helix-turn-helix transcriptional regulator [Candidatus Omnitrophota bacterium]
MLTQLKIFRLSKGLRLGVVAKQAGVSASFLSRIETGKLKGTKETRRKIAKVLGVSEETLFGIN